ncbi:MAG: adenylyltransferase, partial [Gammaproteobacteria bacterium]|nr:adenylyltransferase [Gammaproteobacteria bacterium]
WPIPIVLDVPSSFAEKLEPGQKIALRDPEGFMPAVLTVEESWQPDKKREAQAVYGTDAASHPGVRHLYDEVKETYITGTLEGIQQPNHYDFETLWDTPEEMRGLFEKMGWRRIVAFHTSNPMHRLHREMILSVVREKEAHVLLHPTVGVTKPGDLHYYARVHCYKAIRHHFPHNLAALSLLPLAMRMAGPREALWHAIVNQNFGCTHFIVGPDHASPPSASLTRGNGGEGSKENHTFYSKYQAQQLVKQCATDLQIEIVPVGQWQYSPEKGRFLPQQQLEEQNLEASTYSNTDLKRA